MSLFHQRKSKKALQRRGSVEEQRQCMQQHLFLIIAIKADKQAAKASFSQLRGRVRHCRRITLNLHGVASGKIR